MLYGESVSPCSSSAPPRRSPAGAASKVRFQSRVTAAGRADAAWVVAVGVSAHCRRRLTLDARADLLEEPIFAGEVLLEREARVHVGRAHFRTRNQAMPRLQIGHAHDGLDGTADDERADDERCPNREADQPRHGRPQGRRRRRGVLACAHGSESGPGARQKLKRTPAMNGSVQRELASLIVSRPVPTRSSTSASPLTQRSPSCVKTPTCSLV